MNIFHRQKTPQSFWVYLVNLFQSQHLCIFFTDAHFFLHVLQITLASDQSLLKDKTLQMQKRI